LLIVAEQEFPETDLPQGTPTREIGRHLAVTAGIAALLATVLTAWRPASLDPAELVGQLLAIGGPEAPAAAPVEGVAQGAERLPIGVVAGHSGLHPDSGLADPGAVCDDGLTELQVNAAVAELVMRGLEGAGLEAVQLEEWDPRLNGFHGRLLPTDQ